MKHRPFLCCGPLPVANLWEKRQRVALQVMVHCHSYIVDQAERQYYSAYVAFRDPNANASRAGLRFREYLCHDHIL